MPVPLLVDRLLVRGDRGEILVGGQEPYELVLDRRTGLVARQRCRERLRAAPTASRCETGNAVSLNPVSLPWVGRPILLSSSDTHNLKTKLRES